MEEIRLVEKGCPLCGSDVKGNSEYQFYCDSCNIMFREEQVLKDDVSPKGVLREKGYLYFIDKEGDVSRVKMAEHRGDKGPKPHEKVAKFGLTKEKGYLYYLDKNGFVARSPMKRQEKPKGRKEVAEMKAKKPVDVFKK